MSMSVRTFHYANINQSYREQQRGVTMSPRIQVYKAIACRSLSTESPGPTDLLAFSTSCGDAEVQARAAKIQACMFQPFPNNHLFISFLCSCGDDNECPQCNFDRLLESVGRYTWTKAHPLNLSYRGTLDARYLLGIQLHMN
jgi:hypothetical protein